MITKDLSLWIAQSESWQTFIDFNLPEDKEANYPFLTRPDDFYISLFGELYEILERVRGRKEDMLAVAKGMEIYSLRGKRDFFKGVNQSNNILFAAGLYYLSDYAASAFILSRLFSIDSFAEEIDRFVICFLKRELDTDNRLCVLLDNFLKSGRRTHLRELLRIVIEIKNEAYNSTPYIYSVAFLAEVMLNKFISNNIWNDLKRHNTRAHWRPYVTASVQKSFPMWDFFPSQKNAIERGVLNRVPCIALQTPTSSGKTAICELIIYDEYKRNNNCKVLYLAPFRALASELKQTFGRNLAKLGITSKTIYGGNIPTAAERDLIQNVNLLIATPEKFMAIENSLSEFFNDFNLIICDEGHLLDDGHRGLNYELLLSRLKNNSQVVRKFIFISAIIPNIGSINRWLGGNDETVVQSTYRATEIEYGFLKHVERSDEVYFLDVNPFKNIPQRYRLNNFLTKSDYTYKVSDKERVYKFGTFKVKAVTVALKALNSGSVALFTPSKGGNSGVSALALEAISQIKAGVNVPNPAQFVTKRNTIRDLLEYFTAIFGAQYSLCQLVTFGGLFHHGDLPQYVREVIEDMIRSERVKFVICTNTLAEGVNLPIRTIVISSSRRFNEATNYLEPINLRDLKNLVGRAGRAGKETKGLVIVVNPSDFSTIESVIKDQNIEDVTGYLYTIVSSISRTIARKRLVLSNDILEAQDEEFKLLIDSIDISLIDLLGEEVDTEDVQNTIQNLIDQTFAKFQSTESQSATLNTLVNLRGEKIKPLIETNQFKFLKQSGSTIRLYSQIQDLLQLNNEIWQKLDTPLSDDWINFIVDDILFKIPTTEYKLADFNKRNKSIITSSDIKAILKSWISGSWFQGIAQYSNNDIDIALRFINSFVCYFVQNTIASVIRIVEMKLSDLGVDLSPTVINFPQLLLYGLWNKSQLDLIELGFNERFGIIALSDLLEQRRFRYNELSKLRVYLLANRDVLLDDLDGRIPVISLGKITESFRYLGFSNII